LAGVPIRDSCLFRRLFDVAGIAVNEPLLLDGKWALDLALCRLPLGPFSAFAVSQPSSVLFFAISRSR